MSSEKLSQNQINYVIELYSNGQKQKALEEAEGLIIEFPKEAILYNFSGVCFRSTQDLNSAIDRFKKAISINPKYAEVYYNLALTLKELRRYEESIQSYNKYLELDQKNASVYNNLGVLHQELGQYDSAINGFKQAITIDSDHIDAITNLGNMFIELSKFEDAVECFEKVILIQPDYYEAHNRLGIALKGLDNLDRALQSFNEAIFLEPKCADAHNNIGNIMLQVGKTSIAVNSFEQAVKLLPNCEEFHFNLGISFVELGRLDEATLSYKKALSIQPDYVDAHYNLGNVLCELGLLWDAVKSYKDAINLKSNYYQAHNNLGNTYRKLGEIELSVESLKEVLVINPNHSDAHNNLGVCLMELGLRVEAIECFKKAIEIDSEFVDAYNNLGITSMELGQLDEATKFYESALTYNSNYTIAHHNLSAIKKYSAGDDQILKMESILFNQELSDSDRMHLNFALARVNEDLGNDKEFFEMLHEGNRLRKQRLKYSIDESLKHHKLIKKDFSNKLIRNINLTYKNINKRPIFIVGMPRSGTSLVEQIISSHHEVYGAGELTNIEKLVFPLLRTKEGALSDNDFLNLRNQYLDSLKRFNASEKVITDKMPLNFEYIGFIFSAFPEAKIVHLKRDARATCWSIYKHYFHSEGNGYSYNFDDLSQFYGLYVELMNYWHKLYPEKIYDISYEELTNNQEKETRKLIEYCDLDWDENCLNFHDNKRGVKTASALQVRKKMYRGSSDAWRKYSDYLKPLLEALDPYYVK
ncbi:tetratricopeptide repeat protein [Candidatus Pseudothioglobus singularis]|nr:tetratricopeptide repeat protein [Candidatus Pseudothioglobus singularis]